MSAILIDTLNSNVSCIIAALKTAKCFGFEMACKL